MFDKKAAFVIVIAGLIAGSLDILTAMTDYYIATGKSPAGVLRYIASGVFSNEAFTGGNQMLLWGLLFHFIIAFVFTIVFYIIYRKTNMIKKYPIFSIILYGVLMWFITVKIILPLSNVPMPVKSPPILKQLKAIAILVIMIALPLYLIMKKYYGKKLA